MDVDSRPVTNLPSVLEHEVKITQTRRILALELRDAVLRLRRDGAFVAVPYFRTNTEPSGPHPIGSYEIWVPSETFSSAFFYICENRGELSVLVHPLSKDQRRDYGPRACWMGPPLPLDISAIPSRPLENTPMYYPSLKLGHSAHGPVLTLDDRKRLGQNVENILKNEREAARAPLD
ncbi:hypothetical protein BT96DRAFT_1099783 [Gymnopus androsaceus JB14]|uniref:Uncharacterized protein n=1 Tax=Gymnopus androsaceus JB14 TaxID=1447944 RepID=A0A6A4II34_9AGAR|nr:hypothetical protein BT96DRAFT_1099783 [Gymnopus androsaceus JB14]